MILLEGRRSVAIAKCYGVFQPPRTKFRCVRNASGIVHAQSRRQVVCQTNVEMVSDLGLEDVDVDESSWGHCWSSVPGFALLRRGSLRSFG